jgi:tetratricopeptide (TPR) repeat protein
MGEGAALKGVGDVHYLLGDYPRAREYYEQVLTIAREIADTYFEGSMLSEIGQLSRRQGDYATAQECEEQALHLMRKIGVQYGEGCVLSALGDLHQELGDPPAARGYYEQALCLFHQTETYQTDVFQGLAGLAEAALGLGDRAQAQAHVAEILAYLEAGGMLFASWKPSRIYLTCYRALRACGDPRAPALLATAHRLLQEQAARIPDEAMRRSFLENVAENRELVAEFAAAQQPQ